MLTDPHGRHIHKLRLSLLDACNMRCLYCMPEDAQFMASHQWLSAEEIQRITGRLVELGIDEIRLTGGEPTLRPDLWPIVKGLSTLPLKKLAITTNGIKLAPHLENFRQSKLSAINLSLDSLDPKTFQAMTRTHDLNRVLDALFLAHEMGFEVKVNCVLMRGHNGDEVDAFVDFSARHGIPVRFLELIKIGVAREGFERHFLPAHEVIERLRQRHPREVPAALDSTSFNYVLDNGARIGFIASESRPFCGGCSRLRLGATGKLYPCLMVDDGPSLRHIPLDDYPVFLERVIGQKPTDRIPELARPMHQIGG